MSTSDQLFDDSDPGSEFNAFNYWNLQHDAITQRVLDEPPNQLLNNDMCTHDQVSVYVFLLICFDLFFAHAFKSTLNSFKALVDSSEPGPEFNAFNYWNLKPGAIVQPILKLFTEESSQTNEKVILLFFLHATLDLDIYFFSFPNVFLFVFFL